MLHLYCKLLQLQQVFGFVILGSWQVYYLTVVHSGVGYIIWICFFNDWENMIPVESLISQKNKNVMIWVWQIWWVKLDLSLFLSFWTSVACVKLKFIASTCTPFYKSHIGVFHEANDWMLLQVISDKKACKNDKPTKPPSLSVSPLQNKNDIFSPKSKSKTSKKDLKSSSGGTIPIHMLNVPLNFKTWSDQRILWNALPSTINNLGKVWFMF